MSYESPSVERLASGSTLGIPVLVVMPIVYPSYTTFLVSTNTNVVIVYV